MFNRFKKKLHKLKDPQMLLPFNGVGVKQKYELKIFGTKENNLQFSVHEDGSRSQLYSMTAFVKDNHLYLGYYGDSRCWYPDGKLKGVSHFSKGRQHGKQISWYADGTLRRSWYWHYGEFHGRWMEWYENGVTSFQGHYRHGKKHGKWWEWYENGRMRTSGEFLDGYALDLTVWKPDGTVCPESGVSAGFGYWLSYEENGDLKSRSEISNGEIVYELPDNYKDIEDEEENGDDSTDEYS